VETAEDFDESSVFCQADAARFVIEQTHFIKRIPISDENSSIFTFFCFFHVNPSLVDAKIEAKSVDIFSRFSR
jgi:hypothetical protein